MAAYENPPEAGGSGEKQDDAEERSRVQGAFTQRYKSAKKHWGDWRQEARDLYDFIAGRQWDDADMDAMREQNRPAVTFNISGKYMDAVVGLQINNRQEIRYFPRTNGAAKINEMMTGAVEWCRDLSNMLDEETDAFYDAVLTGMGWMEGYLDKDIEPEGVAAGRRVDNLEMLPDPVARQRNLEDAKFIIRERMVDQDEYEEIFGEYADQVPNDDSVGVDELTTSATDDDSGIQIIPQPHDYGSSEGDTGERMTRGKCPVQDYQFWKRELRYVVEVPNQGAREMTAEEFAGMKEQIDVLASNGIPVNVKKLNKKVYYRAWFSKGRMGPYGLSPYQGGFTYHCITGKRDRNKQMWYGLGRAMIDSQRWTNKFFSTILYTLMVNAKGGLLAEEDSFKDSKNAEAKWADPSSITWLKKGALSGSAPKVMPKPESRYPEGMDRLMQFTMNSLPETTGLNAELLGLVDREQAGVVEAQRKQSAMAVIAWAFDAMRRYYRSMGRQMARYVIDYMPEGMIVKVNGQDSAQYAPLLKSMVNMSFDVIVDEAPTSTNMRERVWAVIETMVPQMLQAGLSIPKEVLDYSPIPADLAAKWKEALQPPPEAEQQKQLQMADMVAEVDGKKAKAEKDRADARARLAEINAPEANAQSDAMIKASSDRQIAEMEAAVEARLEEFKANKKAETELLIARLKLDTEVEKARLQGVIDLKLGEMNARATERQTVINASSKERQSSAANATKEKIAKSRPKPAPRAN